MTVVECMVQGKLLKLTLVQKNGFNQMLMPIYSNVTVWSFGNQPFAHQRSVYQPFRIGIFYIFAYLKNNLKSP